MTDLRKGDIFRLPYLIKPDGSGACFLDDEFPDGCPRIDRKTIIITHCEPVADLVVQREWEVGGEIKKVTLDLKVPSSFNEVKWVATYVELWPDSAMRGDYKAPYVMAESDGVTISFEIREPDNGFLLPDQVQKIEKEGKQS